MRKVITFNVEKDQLTILDSYLVAPVSRSDLMNEILSYMLTNPGTINHFVNKKLDEIKTIVNSIPNNE